MIEIFREMCPHAIGVKNGVKHVLFYQFGGKSSKGLPKGGAWRCMELSRLRNVQIREGKWHTGSSHKKPNTCVDRVILEIKY